MTSWEALSSSQRLSLYRQMVAALEQARRERAELHEQARAYGAAGFGVGPIAGMTGLDRSEVRAVLSGRQRHPAQESSPWPGSKQSHS